MDVKEEIVSEPHFQRSHVVLWLQYDAIKEGNYLALLEKDSWTNQHASLVLIAWAKRR